MVLLHHNIDRVWIITKVALPKLKDISFPDIAFDPDCPFVRDLKHSRTAAQQVEKIRSICRSMRPLISLMKEKDLYYENTITKILKEDILWSLHGSGYSHASSTFKDPASARTEVFHADTNRETPVYIGRKLCQLLFQLWPWPSNYSSGKSEFLPSKKEETKQWLQVLMDNNTRPVHWLGIP